MRLIASVCSAVDSQRAALDEGLLAGLIVAGVGSLVRVDTVVPLQVGLAVEALSRRSLGQLQVSWPSEGGSEQRGGHTFAQPSCHLHWKGRACWPGLAALPLATYCLLIRSAIVVGGRQQWQVRVGDAGEGWDAVSR